MAYKRIPTLCIEDAEIFWKNFSGREQQYNEKGDAKVSLEFAGHGFDILVHNPDKLEPGDAQVKRALCDDVKVENVTGNSVRIPKQAIEMLSTDKCHTVEIYIE